MVTVEVSSSVSSEDESSEEEDETDESDAELDVTVMWVGVGEYCGLSYEGIGQLVLVVVTCIIVVP